jgi:hypothetical protein
MIRFIQFLNKNGESSFPTLDEVIITEDGNSVHVLREGKWVPGRFQSNIRIDQPTHGAGQTHAHVLGRKGVEIGVVNVDGSASHGTKCRLHGADADALRARGFDIRSDNIVEWAALSDQKGNLLLGRIRLKPWRANDEAQTT